MLPCGNCEPLKRVHSEIGTHGGVPCNDTEVVLLSIRNILLAAAVVVLCTGAAAVQVKAAAAPGPSARQTAPARYRVQRGDTFFSISRKFNISVQQLQQANNMSGNSRLRGAPPLLFPRLHSRAAMARLRLHPHGQTLRRRLHAHRPAHPALSGRSKASAASPKTCATAPVRSAS
jgi:LysM repeat protein